MRSAYSVLGVHGNAKPGDIEFAFRALLSTFTRERIAVDEGAAEKLSDVMDAYKVLRNPDMRAAHDRRLAQAVSTEPVSSWVEIRYPEQEHSLLPRLLVVLVVLVSLVFAGSYVLERIRARHLADVAANRAAEQQAHQAPVAAPNQRSQPGHGAASILAQGQQLAIDGR